MKRIVVASVVVLVSLGVSPRDGDAQDAPVVAEVQAAAKKAPAADASETARFLKALQEAGDELTVFDWILHETDASAHIADLIGGAHALVPDKGALYDKARALPSAVERTSSHASLGPQFEIPGPTSGPILFGKTTDGLSTWFQLEGYRAELTLRTLPALIGHMWDFALYKLTGKNQSRFGSSKDTEDHPLELTPVARTAGISGLLEERVTDAAGEASGSDAAAER